MQNHVMIGLNAVIFANRNNTLCVLVTKRDDALALPFGFLNLSQPRTLEMTLRKLVKEQTGFQLDYVEQVYTFGDQGRDRDLFTQKTEHKNIKYPIFNRIISIAYMALSGQAENVEKTGGFWEDIDHFFPYEYQMQASNSSSFTSLFSSLNQWAEQVKTNEEIIARKKRISSAFKPGKFPLNEERVLDRYELLYEANLLPESFTDQGRSISKYMPDLGYAMISDHRRILATSLARLRSKIKYRPILFELLKDQFTLGEAQALAEAICGFSLHKQNFRRSLFKTDLIEGLNHFKNPTSLGGRPAELYRFKREKLKEGPVLGIQTPRLK